MLNLAAEAQQALLTGQISAGHGRALLKLKGDGQQQRALALLTAEDWTVRETERLGELVKEHNDDFDRALAALRARAATPAAPGRRVAAEPRTGTAAKAGTAEDQEVKREMERILGTPVQIQRTGKDLRVTIVFHTEAKIQEFFDLLNNAS